MANIQERRDKSGKLISYSIRVFRGRGADGKQLKPFTATFDVSLHGQKKAQEKRLRLSPQPLKSSAKREPPPIPARPLQATAIM